jgi:hypothetical protein
VWRRRLSLFGIVLLTIGVGWVEHGAVVSGGWMGSLIEVGVCLEVLLMGMFLLGADLFDLVKRVMKRREWRARTMGAAVGRRPPTLMGKGFEKSE